MNTIAIDILKILLGAIVSIATAFVLLRAENNKLIMAKKHEFAVKDLGEKIFNPLLSELLTYESKKKLGRSYQFPIEHIIKLIIANQYLLLFTSEDVRNVINNIYEFATTTSNISNNNIKTQDDLIYGELLELRKKLSSLYSVYRM